MSLPGLLTFAALSLAALIGGVSLTRLVPGLGGEHPGLVALVLLGGFWALREIWQRRRIQRRLLAEIDALSEEVIRLSDAKAAVAPVRHVANEQPRSEPRPDQSAEQRIEPRFAAIATPEPVDDGTLLDAVRDALNNNRVELHVQPIVSLPQRRIRFFELLARPRDAEGNHYQAADCLSALDAAGLRAEFDVLMLLRGVQLVRKLEQRAKDVGFFLNLSPSLLTQIDTFNPLFDFLQREREHAANIVLEFAFDGVRQLDRTGLYRMGQISALGFALSVDGIDNFDVDFASLSRHGVRFLKFNAAVFSDIDAIAKSPVDLADLREICERNGMLPVLSKVEGEAELIKLSDLDFPLGQGMLFGAPKLAKAA
jgi:cyclic-di-GMP phosphodiesterase, flagellum assembly factor TipF